MTADGPKPKTTDEVFKGKKVVLFAVPGAFTPTCHKNHLPGFVTNADAIKAKGVDAIAVTGVNDPFVMDAWKKATGADGKIEFLADGNGDFAKAIGLALDASADGLGMRSKRYSMVVEDGVVKSLNDRGSARQGRRLRRRRAAEAALDRTEVPRHARPCGNRVVCAEVSGYSRDSATEQRSCFSRISAMPSRASSSARSFRSWPAWPLTQCQVTSWRAERRIEPLPQVDVLHRLLVGGAPAVPLPAVDPGR